MTDNECICPICLHPTCPLPSAEPPYDELTHEVDDNVISVKIPKNCGIDPDPRDEERLSFDFNCTDSEGQKCKTGCTKVHVIPEKRPPGKTADEELLSLKSRRHVMPNEDVQNTLEIEFKAPRNYIPLPEPGPPPPIIVPKVRIRRRRRKRGKK
ncbi:uncharacterized protein LOC113464082 [Ceratina calcarata]|uniref:Uncharacterized protein LOC113464082 n=1 Tax=Ceratina calcarata TaxID=156304 RepID=A0AAJ7W943_9HYME|nr:uncharacterized protein LOC113464082 [Ceratina calcarata]